jgi:hypothetical protein
MDGWHLGTEGESLEGFITRVLAETDAPLRDTARFLAGCIGGVMEVRRGDDWKAELAGLLREVRGALARGMQVFEEQMADDTAALALRFGADDAAAIDAFMAFVPNSDQARVLQGAFRRAGYPGVRRG